MKGCSIQLCKASLACFFGLAPFAKKPLEKKQNGTYLLETEVYRGSTESQSVGVVIVQLDQLWWNKCRTWENYALLLTHLETYLLNFTILQVKPKHMKRLASVKVLSRRYVLSERLLHALERLLYPGMHYLTGLLSIFLNKCGRVWKKDRMLPKSLTDNWVEPIPWLL